MEHRNHGTPVLFEITIVVLFFALSATVVLGVFLDARHMSEQADALGRAAYAAQALAEQLSGRQQPEEYLTSVGFEEDGRGAWQKSDQEVELSALLSASAEAAGLLWTGTIRAAVRGQAAELPLAWYLPGEGAA